MWETWVQSLGWEDPLEKGKATYSSILAWRIPILHGVANSWTWLSDFHFHLYIGTLSLHTVASSVEDFLPKFIAHSASPESLFLFWFFFFFNWRIIALQWCVGFCCTRWIRHERENCSVVSDSLLPHELYSPWNSPGQNTGVGSLSLLQGTFPTQGLNPGLLHCRRILYLLSHQGSSYFP